MKRTSVATKTYRIYFCLESRNAYGNSWGWYRAESPSEALERFYADTGAFRDDGFEAREVDSLRSKVPS